MLASSLSGEFLSHIRFWLYFYLESFSYTSRAGFTILCGVSLIRPIPPLKKIMWRVSLTHPMLASFLSGEFLLHIPCWLYLYLRSFSYTSRAGVIFIYKGVSLTHPVLVLLFFGEFLLDIPCWLLFFLLFFIRGVSLTHRVLTSFLSGELLSHIQFWL